MKARDASGATLQYIKYDAMIVASAIRHRADCLVTRDGPMKHLAEQAKLPCFAPEHFFSRQGTLPGIKSKTKPKLVKQG